MSATISLIAAVDQNGVIGKDGVVPWHLPDDLRFFRRVTMGKPVIMGRRTYDSIGKPLSGRHNIILTRNPGYVAPGCTVARSIPAALAAAGAAPEIMIAGGAELYAALLPTADRLYLTLVETRVEDGDTFFPAFDPDAWQEVSREHHSADDRHACAFEWVILERARPPQPT